MPSPVAHALAGLTLASALAPSRAWRRLAIVAALAFGLPASAIQTRDANPLVSLLVWDADRAFDSSALPHDVRDELTRLQERARAYRSPRPRAADSDGTLAMVYEAQVRYERRLFAIADGPDATARAVRYVDQLRPCYEWEGYHDCPEREATFAERYQREHPGDGLNEYLSLLAAHRWICAAEGYDYEKQPADAARSRRAYTDALAAARVARSPLMRAAAAQLARRGTCF
jgi:hypothetical protein